MKKFGKWIVLCICILGMATGCTKKQEATEEVTPEVEAEVVVPKEEVAMVMEFVNETGESIGIVKVRPTEEYDWSSNLVTDEAWKDRYEMPIYINGILPDIENGWQVKTTTVAGEETLWEDVALEDNTTITFSIEDEVPFVSIQQTEVS